MKLAKKKKRHEILTFKKSTLQFPDGIFALDIDLDG